MEHLINYKKRIASRFMALEGDAVAEKFPDAENFIYSEKIDGHLGFAVVSGNDVKFYNRSGTLLDLPSLSVAFPKVEGTWAGELHLAGDRSRSYYVSSAIANSKDDVLFTVFDAVHLLEKTVFERIEIVEKSIPKSARVNPVDWKRTADKNEILEFYNESIANGKEGVVAHLQHGISFKLKPLTELDLTVIAYSLKEDGTGLRALLVGVKNKDNWEVVGSVGGGFSDIDRLEWLTKLNPIETKGDIVMVAKNKLAYIFVKPEIVVQIKCLDIISEDAVGTIFKEVLYFDENLGYQSKGKIAGVSVISPVFQMIRADKKPGLEDTGINQISDRIEISEETAAEVSKAESEILFRKVYTKESKTGVAIRKFVGIKTNKTKDFPNYLLYYTDFSAGRKDPLQTDVNIAATEEILFEKFAASLDENVKKGWNLMEK